MLLRERERRSTLVSTEYTAADADGAGLCRVPEFFYRVQAVLQAEG